MTELRLEALVPEMEFGTVVRWLKQEGDPVEAGEVIVEVEAEKVVQEGRAPVGGTLREIVAVEGDELRVGARARDHRGRLMAAAAQAGLLDGAAGGALPAA